MGYAADGVHTCLSADSALKKESYDLIILDVNLPDGNGFDLCRKIMAVLNRIAVQKKRDVFDDGHLYIDFLELTAAVQGAIASFTPMEYRTLKLLSENPKHVLSGKCCWNGKTFRGGKRVD